MTPTGQIGAVLSDCGRYRYLLWRIWNYSNPKRLLVIGFNPSTADAKNDDPTVIRCGNLARREGCGGFEVANLYAWRATDQRQVRWAKQRDEDPVGVECGSYIREALLRCEIVVAAWGSLPAERERVEWVCTAASYACRPLLCLGRNRNGSPKHPLYLAGDTPLEEWRP